MADIVERLRREMAEFWAMSEDNVQHDEDFLRANDARFEAADTIDRQREEFDANVDRLKACEHIADGDEGWERLRNECPSTAAVARLRDEHDRQREEIGRLRRHLEVAITIADRLGGGGVWRNSYMREVADRWRSALSDTTRERSEDAPTSTGDS